jgi:hypothetical protein
VQSIGKRHGIVIGLHSIPRAFQSLPSQYAPNLDAACWCEATARSGQSLRDFWRSAADSIRASRQAAITMIMPAEVLEMKYKNFNALNSALINLSHHGWCNAFNRAF